MTQIIQEPNFIVKPHVFLLGILFRMQAFQAPGLIANPDKLQMAKIHDGETGIRFRIGKGREASQDGSLSVCSGGPSRLVPVDKAN